MINSARLNFKNEQISEHLSNSFGLDPVRFNEFSIELYENSDHNRLNTQES